MVISQTNQPTNQIKTVSRPTHRSQLNSKPSIMPSNDLNPSSSTLSNLKPPPTQSYQPHHLTSTLLHPTASSSSQSNPNLLYTPSPSRPASTDSHSLQISTRPPRSSNHRQKLSISAANPITFDQMPQLDSHSARLIVVSNRLPITITAHEPTCLDGTSPLPSNPKKNYTFKMSSGGLVSALSGCKRQMNFSWIGWSGLAVPESDRATVQARLASEYSCKPVWLSDELADRH